MDRAFTFYYPENLEGLIAAGAELVPFSPLDDPRLPPVSGLYIGGGFPEVFMERLEANAGMREDVRRAVAAGVPAWAECRGLMYLSRGISWGNRRAAMAGALPCSVEMQDRPAGHVYVLLEETGRGADRRKVFDIDLLADRLLLAKAWLEADTRTAQLGIGYFGASTGAGAALQAAARNPSNVKAVVSRGGRADLAEPYLKQVTAPTLLIVGSCDFTVIEMNQSAYELLPCEKKLIIVPGATHLFEEPGTLEQVADHSGGWFLQYCEPAVKSIGT